MSEDQQCDPFQDLFNELSLREKSEDIFNTALAEHLDYLQNLPTNAIRGVLVGQPVPISSAEMRRYHIYVWNLLTSDQFPLPDEPGRDLLEVGIRQAQLSKTMRNLPVPIYVSFSNVFPKDLYDLYEKLGAEYIDIEEHPFY